MDVSAKQKKSPFSQPRQRSLLFSQRQQASGHQAKVLGIFITRRGWESLISCYILFPSLPSPRLQQTGSSSTRRMPALPSPRLPLSNSFIQGSVCELVVFSEQLNSLRSLQILKLWAQSYHQTLAFACSSMDSDFYPWL